MWAGRLFLSVKLKLSLRAIRIVVNPQEFETAPADAYHQMLASTIEHAEGTS